MQTSLYCITLWAVFLLWNGRTAPFFGSEKTKEEANIVQQGRSTLNCAEADAYAAAHRAEWVSIWSDMEVNPKLAESVIYPELIRYSYWQDELERGAVSNSYVMIGTAGPNFSVGHFQMKASWIEALERRWMKCPLHRTLEIYFDTSDSRFARKARLARLSDDAFWQPVYLALYLRLLYIDYPDLSALPMDEQVRLCATAYNNGAALPGPALGDVDKLYRWSSLSSFHTDLVATPFTQMYCYGEISAAHYKNLQ